MIPFARLLIASSALLAAAGIVSAFLLRRRSAAERHLVWLAALLSLAVLPLALLLPRWEPPAPLANATARTVIYVTGGGGADPGAPGTVRSLAPTALTATWLLGAALGLGRLVRAHVRTRAVVRRATDYRDGGRVRLSPETAVPFVHGIRQPIIVLPAAAAREWNGIELDLVLAHERMHVRRRDNRWHALASAVAALYWPQPLVWVAMHRMRQECERACDDGVLVNGSPAADYAGVLVNIARAAAAQQHAPAVPAAGGIAMMNRPSQLKHRVEALLAARLNRQPATRGFTAGAAGLALAAALVVGGLDAPLLLAQPGRFAGVVRDASGATIPKARVDLSAGQNGSALHDILYTNDAGEFAFLNVPDGAYNITVLKPGFAALTHSNLQFESAKARPLELTLQLGQIRETVTVSGAGAPPAPATPPSAASTGAAPTRIRVGGNVQAAKLVTRVNPIYPADAKLERVDGIVLLRAIIGTDGGILNIETVNRSVDARLVTAAMDAVKQWRYQPTLLNGKPVEIITMIEVNYTLAN